MPKRAGLGSEATARAMGIAEQFGYEFVEAELAEEREGRFLRFYVDKPGGITLDDLEKYHRKLQPYMDSVDYDYMEVSSPGAERPLVKPADFQRAVGKTVEVRLYKPIDGKKRFTGELLGRFEDGIALRVDGAERRFPLADVAKAAPVVRFDETMDIMEEIP